MRNIDFQKINKMIHIPALAGGLIPNSGVIICKSVARNHQRNWKPSISFEQFPDCFLFWTQLLNSLIIVIDVVDLLKEKWFHLERKSSKAEGFLGS